LTPWKACVGSNTPGRSSIGYRPLVSPDAAAPTTAHLTGRVCTALVRRGKRRVWRLVLHGTGLSVAVPKPISAAHSNSNQGMVGKQRLLAYAHAGRCKDALSLINEPKQRRQKGHVPAGAFIDPHLALGDYDQAFFWCEEAYKEQSAILQSIKVHPLFVRSRARRPSFQRPAPPGRL
jgi:hypothetical protein